MVSLTNVTDAVALATAPASGMAEGCPMVDETVPLSRPFSVCKEERIQFQTKKGTMCYTFIRAAARDVTYSNDMLPLADAGGRISGDLVPEMRHPMLPVPAGFDRNRQQDG